MMRPSALAVWGLAAACSGEKPTSASPTGVPAPADTAPTPPVDSSEPPPGDSGRDSGGDSGDGPVLPAVPVYPEDLDPADVVPEPGCWSVADPYLLGTAPRGERTSEVSGPVPTHEWWTSLIWDAMDWGDAFSTDMHAHPMILKADASGLKVHHAPRPTVDSATDTRFMAGSSDLHIGVQGLSASAATLADHTDWTVTAAWVDDTHALQATFGRGLPYAFFEGSGDPLVVEVGAGWSLVEEGPGYRIITVSGERHYGLFAPPDATWSTTGNTFTVDRSILSVAALPDLDADTRVLLRTHAFARPVDTAVSWSYDEASAELWTRYAVTAESLVAGETDEPLLALYPHQWRVSDQTPLDLAYASPRGPMRLLAGHVFETRQPFHGLLPGLPLLADTDPALLGRLLGEEDLPSLNTRSDSYWGGKGLGRLTGSLHLARLLGDDTTANAADELLRASLEDWFSGATQQTPLFARNEEWSTLIGYPDAYGSASELNDHHFHWSYFLHGAAHVALNHPTWARDSQWGGLVKLLVRDAASPMRGDTDYPFLRSFDPYAGHSWANGHAGFPDGNNQESSSESVYFASGLILYGEATGNRAIRDLGVYLYVTETNAIHDYWFDLHGDTWSPTYAHETAGMVWGSGVAYATWFSGEPEMKLGIQYLPIHAGSLHLGRLGDKLDAQYDEVLTENGGPPDVWAGLLWSGLATGKGTRAWSLLEPVLDDYPTEEGESRAFTYHWVRTLSELGAPAGDVLADIATYGVFDGEAGRTHVAFHAGCAPRTVHFTDGESLSVDPRTLVASRDGVLLGSWRLGSCEAAPETPCEESSGHRYHVTPTQLDPSLPGEVSTLTIPVHSGYFVNVRPSDEALILRRSATGITGAWTGGAPSLQMSLDSAAVGQAVQAQLSVDLEGDGTPDWQALYGYWPTDGAAGSWEQFTGSAVVSESGSLADFSGGEVTLELWSAFGGAAVELRVGDSWVELPLE